jgi:hypothetical protein
MKAYSRSDEENVRHQATVRDWVSSGLLDATQDSVLQADLQVSLRRTNSALRAVLAFFTMVIVFAAVSLTGIIIHAERDAGWTILGLWGVICAVSAWVLVRKARLYRCGVEEALGLLAVSLLAGALGGIPSWDLPVFVGLLTAVVVGAGIYLVFGFRYAVVVATVLLGVAPFALSADWISERILSLSLFTLVFFVARYVKRLYSGELEEDDLAWVQGVAFAGFYLACNLILTGRWSGLYTASQSGWFYWSTYAGVWIVPVLALWLGIRGRDRVLIDLGWLAALATILTNKSYLSWPRQTWDPILLGILLMGTAVALRRWLAKGPNGERAGFTPLRVLDSENRALAAASALSLVLPHAPAASPSQPSSFKPGGGQSGGGGASGDFK